MTEFQADEIISLLQDLGNKLDSIESKLSDIENNTSTSFTLKDIDDVHKVLTEIRDNQL